jgi:hypothetical protein
VNKKGNSQAAKKEKLSKKQKKERTSFCEQKGNSQAS